MAEIRITVLTQTGTPIFGAGLKLLRENVDYTSPVWGLTTAFTRGQGLFSYTYPGSTTNLQPGVYQIVANATGYAEKVTNTAITFDGAGRFTITQLSESAAAGTFSTPPAHVSSLYPVPVTVTSPGSATGALIQASVLAESGNASLLAVPVIGGEANINLQARLRLSPSMHLVADSDNALTDPDFSAPFLPSFNKLSPSGSSPLSGTVSLWAAPVVPDGSAGGVNSLETYTNTAGPAKWLTPWAELPKFLGHYADAQIWLPVQATGAYTLSIAYLNINRVSIATESKALPGSLFAPGKTVRIRIPDAPDEATHYATLSISQGGVVQTQTLTVRYVR